MAKCSWHVYSSLEEYLLQQNKNKIACIGLIYSLSCNLYVNGNILLVRSLLYVQCVCSFNIQPSHTPRTHTQRTIHITIAMTYVHMSKWILGRKQIYDRGPSDYTEDFDSCNSLRYLFWHHSGIINGRNMDIWRYSDGES